MDAIQAREERDVEARHNWHIWCFTSLGFGPEQAEILELAGADWREAGDLLDRGCPPETAILILT